MTDKEVYQRTFELFEGCCVYCGSPYIHMHHIRYGGLYGGRKTYMGNVIPLCEKHHRLVHTNKNKYMPELIEKINKRIEEA
jgi:5-methylcytosine-specific restriction endonuclease McrA